MKRRSRTYTLKVRRTEDGQLRIVLKSLEGNPRYFKDLKALLAFLRREWPEPPRD